MVVSDSHPSKFLKFCPHCGAAGFRAVSGKEFVCAGCGFRFFTNSAAAVAAIIVDGEGRVMLTRRAVDPWEGMLDLPGGFVDPDEAAEDALARELREELGAELESATYICSRPNRYVFSGYMVSTTDLAFVCRLRTDTLPAPHDDIDHIEWHAPEQMPMDRIAAPSIRAILQHYIKMLQTNK